SEVGGSPKGVLRTAVTHPWTLVEKAFGHRGVHYLIQLGLPLAALWAIAPLALVAALPDLAINLLSATPTQTSIHFHYVAGIGPPADTQLPVCPGRDLDRRRRDGARLGRQARTDPRGDRARAPAPQSGLEARVRAGRRARLPPRPAAVAPSGHCPGT